MFVQTDSTQLIESSISNVDDDVDHSAIFCQSCVSISILPFSDLVSGLVLPSFSPSFERSSICFPTGHIFADPNTDTDVNCGDVCPCLPVLVLSRPIPSAGDLRVP